LYRCIHVQVAPRIRTKFLASAFRAENLQHFRLRRKGGIAGFLLTPKVFDPFQYFVEHAERRRHFFLVYAGAQGFVSWAAKQLRNPDAGRSSTIMAGIVSHTAAA